MSDIQITNLTADDCAEVRKLGLSTEELHIDNGTPEYYSIEMLRDFFSSPTDIYLAARVDGTLAGYFLINFNPYLKEAYLIDLVIKPEFRGLGIATLFFDRVFELLKERDCIWAWALVHQDNKKMMEIFEKKGFYKGREFTFFFKDKPF
jgi:ribosomal protein S18 acetylase RimI-like enzyme